MKILKGKQLAPRRILLYGQHGVGKSTWAAKAPNAIFLNCEDGLNDIDCDKTEYLKSFNQVMETLNWMASNDHDYKTIVVDTIDWVEQMIFKDICVSARVESVADIDFGKGFPRAIPKWKMFLEFLEALRRGKGMAIILLAHARVEKFSNPEGATYDRYAPDLWTNSRGEGAGNMIQEWCDEVLFAQFRVMTTTEGKGFNQKQVAVGGKEAYLRTKESASCLAKNRIGLPEEMPLDFNAYMQFVKEAYKNIKPAVETKPAANLAGLVVDGSSKVKDEMADVAAHF